MCMLLGQASTQAPGESGEPSRPSDVFRSGKMNGDDEELGQVRDEAGQVQQRPDFTRLYKPC